MADRWMKKRSICRKHLHKRCPYCDVPMLGGRTRPTKDHCVPRSRGGDLNDGNMVIVCWGCNTAKGDRTIIEFHADLLAVQDPRAAHVGVFIQRLNLQMPHVLMANAIAVHKSLLAAPSSRARPRRHKIRKPRIYA